MKHKDILPVHPATPDPAAPIIRPTNRSPDNPNVLIPGPYFRVRSDLSHVPLADYIEHGFETRKEFRESVEELVRQWHDRVGECVEERLYRDRWGDPDTKNRQLHLQFHDAPGNTPESAWLPSYLCDPCPIPRYMRHKPKTRTERLKQEITDRLWNRKKSHRRT